ncbi:glycoside hydrolase family 25 protein [Actinophytocola sp.]|uniref:glycoside hydrolase family 25 protein n=1 Tax=Actinophytocola sp. TaxID=1872138 RepID=UPI002ED57BAC
MAIFGLDISHHQDLKLDLGQCRREGIEFVFIKASEGSTFLDPEFAANLDEARTAGLLTCAYHYLRSSASAAAQVSNVARAVPRDVPVIPDVETGSGGIGLLRDFVDRLRANGYHVPLTYLPRWYWQQLGSPSLAGLPPLWSSRYPDNVVGSLTDEWADVPGHYWNGYGGLDVAVLQFTSSVRIAGHQPIDANAYRGTREQLAVLLGRKEEDHPVKHLILAREMGGPAVWVGDGLTRRHIADETELAGLQYWIGQKGGDPTVREFADLRVLGTPGGTVDVDEGALAKELLSRGWDGVTAAEVREIIIGAFARAAKPEGVG